MNNCHLQKSVGTLLGLPGLTSKHQDLTGFSGLGGLIFSDVPMAYTGYTPYTLRKFLKNLGYTMYTLRKNFKN